MRVFSGLSSFTLWAAAAGHAALRVRAIAVCRELCDGGDPFQEVKRVTLHDNPSRILLLVEFTTLGHQVLKARLPQLSLQPTESVMVAGGDPGEIEFTTHRVDPFVHQAKPPGHCPICGQQTCMHPRRTH